MQLKDALEDRTRYKLECANLSNNQIALRKKYDAMEQEVEKAKMVEQTLID